ncbi:MAG: hypothetical protein WC829_12415 [Hyphomicrobium sp.]|jgi:hypothetical protein
MSAINEQLSVDPPPPFRGHPFGGLTRENRGALSSSSYELSVQSDRADRARAAEDIGGFDFHLGVYASF